VSSEKFFSSSTQFKLNGAVPGSLGHRLLSFDDNSEKKEFMCYQVKNFYFRLHIVDTLYAFDMSMYVKYYLRKSELLGFEET